MAGARTEAGPTAAEAATHTGAALMEEAARTARAVAGDILVPADRAAAARISAAVAAMEDSEAAEAGRRDIRRRRGRVAARMEARRHGSQAAIPQALTAPGVTDGLAEVTAAVITALAGLVTGTVRTGTPGMETPAAPGAWPMAETAERMAARDKVDRIATAARTGIRASGAVVIARLRVAVTRGRPHRAVRMRGTTVRARRVRWARPEPLVIAEVARPAATIPTGRPARSGVLTAERQPEISVRTGRHRPVEI
jgi:hypothetical protein